MSMHHAIVDHLLDLERVPLEVRTGTLISKFRWLMKRERYTNYICLCQLNPRT